MTTLQHALSLLSLFLYFACLYFCVCKIAILYFAGLCFCILHLVFALWCNDGESGDHPAARSVLLTLLVFLSLCNIFVYFSLSLFLYFACLYFCVCKIALLYFTALYFCILHHETLSIQLTLRAHCRTTFPLWTMTSRPFACQGGLLGGDPHHQVTLAGQNLGSRKWTELLLYKFGCILVPPLCGRLRIQGKWTDFSDNGHVAAGRGGPCPVAQLELTDGQMPSKAMVTNFHWTSSPTLRSCQ